MGETVEVFDGSNGAPMSKAGEKTEQGNWYEEEIDVDLKSCFAWNRAELEKREEKYDIMVGDLADPMEGGPCYQLHTKSFYEQVIKPKLHNHGIFVTQAGSAGVLTHKEVFSSIYSTLKHVFKYTITYTAHVPSFVDTWGWVMASDEPFILNAEEIDERINERINGELLYLNGESFISSTTMNKSVHQSLLTETHVCTEENARFIHGHGQGRACCARAAIRGARGHVEGCNQL